MIVAVWSRPLAEKNPHRGGQQNPMSAKTGTDGWVWSFAGG
jgi:hypothetical protein